VTEDREPTVRLDAWSGPWDRDDPDANFKADVALYAQADPLVTIRGLAEAMKVPVGAIVRYVLAKWASGGSGGLLELGPTMTRRLWAPIAAAEAQASDPARLAAVQERRATLGRLVRAYGGPSADLAAVLAWAKQAGARLAELEGDTDKITALADEEAELATQVGSLAADLTALRAAAAEKFATEVTAELRKMEDANKPLTAEQQTAMVQGPAASFGPATAKVQIVEFSDFQCPFCARVEPTLQQIREEYKGKIRLAWKHQPLSFGNIRVNLEIEQSIAKIAIVNMLLAFSYAPFDLVHKRGFSHDFDFGIGDQEE